MFNKQFIKSILKETLEAENLIKALQIVAEAVVSAYPHTSIWFAETFGKRQSFLTGAGKELYIPQEKIQLNEKYTVFLQNFQNIPEDEKNILLTVLKLMVFIHS